MGMKEEDKRELYCKPELTKLDNLKEITRDCSWNCSFGGF